MGNPIFMRHGVRPPGHVPLIRKWIAGCRLHVPGSVWPFAGSVWPFSGRVAMFSGGNCSAGQPHKAFRATLGRTKTHEGLLPDFNRSRINGQYPGVM